MDFEEISCVIPFLELAYDSGYVDLDKDQGFVPRMYKTHAWYPFCPKNAGKYIYVIRCGDPGFIWLERMLQYFASPSFWVLMVVP